jgi:DNA invertase Pin-like site-specific DNA recombinase
MRGVIFIKTTEKDRVRERVRNSSRENIEVIPAKPKQNIFADGVERRVAVYVRVSTENIRQTTSYEMQQMHYTDFVAKQPGWNLVGIYEDEGISGTSIKNRKGFQQMIEDCENGEIDLIVTKSISRWSRNILDAIGVVERLKALRPPVGAYFEVENIFSLNPEQEMPFGIHSTVAEHDSRLKSEAMKISLEMRFSRGIYLTPPLFGYDNDADRNLIVNEEESPTVRLIFYMYLSGYNTQKIAEILTKNEKRTKLGNVNWTSSSITKILRNERYCGDVLAWKTFTPSFRSRNSLKNRGERPQYYKKDMHEPIISRDDFIAVQKMLDNAKYGGNFLPKLQVESSGALKGFVSVNPRWNFAAEDYADASNSVLEVLD